MSELTRVLSKLVGPLAFLAALVALWQCSVTLFDPPGYLFPSPFAVGQVFIKNPYYLFSNLAVTFAEMVFGLGIGMAAGVCTALLLSQIRLLDRLLMPLVIATQTLPVFAIAPLLVIWFGFGAGSKIAMAALIIFFPIASTFYDGLKSTPQTYLDLGRSWRLSKWQMLLHIQIPAALPSLVSGAKVAAAVAPIGAVVGEWAGAAGGLGFIMLQANARTQTAVVFAALVLLAISAWFLRWAVVQLAGRMVWWGPQNYQT